MVLGYRGSAFASSRVRRELLGHSQEARDADHLDKDPGQFHEGVMANAISVAAQNDHDFVWRPCCFARGHANTAGNVNVSLSVSVNVSVNVSVQCSMFNVHYSLFIVQCSVFNVQCSMFMCKDILYCMV